jgi:hypothetical protein
VAPGLAGDDRGGSVSIQALCTACSPFSPRPSIVTIVLPAAAPTGVMQDRVASPSISAVQAP